jgi:hypothetical protein
MSQQKPPTAVFSRRQLLSLAGISAGTYMLRNPVLQLLQIMVDGMISRAVAEEAGTTLPRNYVFMGLPGGPSRWQFDLLLKPSPTSPYAANGGVATKIVSTAASNSYAYQTNSMMSGGKNFAMPPVWSTQVNTSSGATPVSQLMNNALFIRGCDLKQDGHPTNYSRQVRANGGGASLSGLVADAANSPVPAVAYSFFGTYASIVGTPEVQLGQGDPISELMTPFSGFNNFGFRKDPLTAAAVDTALQALSQYSLSYNPGAAKLFATRRNAEKLILRQFGDVGAKFNTLYAKYSAAINSTITDPTAGGLMPVVIPTNTNPNEFQTFNVVGPTILQMPAGTDLRSVVTAATRIDFLANSLALMEFVLTEGIASSVSGGSYVMETTHPNGTVFAPNHDQHATGIAMTTYLGSVYYRGLAAGLLEFIKALKGSTNASGANLFEETVIHLAGDFNRSPRTDGSGSDHGFNANSVAVFSGALPAKLQLVGNILTNNPDKVYSGTWGAAAGMDYLSGRTMGIGNIASTVSDLLRVESPTKNDASLFPKSGSFDAIDEAKNV